MSTVREGIVEKWGQRGISQEISSGHGKGSGEYPRPGAGILDFFSASVARTLLIAMGLVVVFYIAVWEAGVAWLGFGPETMWVNLHYATAIMALFTTMFLLDLLYFSRKASGALIRGLKIGSAFLTILIVLVVILGIIPDMPFDSNHLSGTFSGPYGTSTVNSSGVGNFTGPLLFDMMEHTTLVGPGIAAIGTVVTWHYKERVITDRKVNRSALTILVLGLVWMLALAVIGVLLVKTMTYPTGI